jgi:hypothetical protein
VATLALSGLGLLVAGSANTEAKPQRGALGSSSVRAASRVRVDRVRVTLQPRVTDLYHPASIAVSGIAAHDVEVRLLGATDRAGLAYQWAPYRWRRLQLQRGTWRGVLPTPPLLGIYQVQLRLDDGRRVLSSANWLLRVFPPGAVRRRSFPTAVAAVRDYVAHLPGDQVLVALKPWPQAAFDHRDRRLHEFFMLAYAPRADNRVDSRIGLFITTVRDGFHGHWRLLQAAVGPYD